MKPCKICGRWYHSLHKHHIVFKSSLKKSEKKDKDDIIEICWQCHPKVQQGIIKIKESQLTKEQIDYVIHKKWPGWFRIDWGK